MRNIVHWAHMPARPAQHATFPVGLDDRLRAALWTRGVTDLYTHQAEAVTAALRGKHVAVVTPASSGKTLCYNLPTLHHLLADPHSRALYLFPTKALAQDQLAELKELLGVLSEQESRGTLPVSHSSAPAIRTRSAGSLPCGVYDGDTPPDQRAKIRDTARLILSNPDMLHAGILPQHTRWAAFFANLRVVVIDEIHVYRGVFGSHVANVLRRLRRICRFYGSNPQFILASATIANPALVAARLVEAPVTIIGPEQNGAPQGDRQVLFYNPPMLDPALGIRRSGNLETADLAAHFLHHDVQAIVFARARLTTELILAHLRDVTHTETTGESPAANRRLRNRSPKSEIGNSRSAIRGYRGGYLPSQRREIEQGLRDGTVRCVVATNALELGIDIGQLDAVLLAGYPGTIASARQQMGRAGRRQATSVAVLVATASALDQYMVTHPDYLLGASTEHALLNPDNEVILAGHLACAAAELPIELGENFSAGAPIAHQVGDAASLVPDLLADLVEAGQLYRAENRFYWAGEGYPAAGISLRSTSPDRVVIQIASLDGNPQVIGELDRYSVPLLLYENAIYIHEGASYLVERLDWDAGIASVRPVEADFYTRPSISEAVEVVAEREATASDREPTANRRQPTGDKERWAGSEPSSFRVAWGDVRVVSQATGYRVLRRTTNEVLGFGTIALPEQILETQACWLAFSGSLIEQLKATGEWLSDPNEYGPEWPAQRDAARARDGYRCQACGAAEFNSRQHDVHHRIPFRAFLADTSLRGAIPKNEVWRAANRLENLITLCPACHRQAEASVRTRSGLGGVAALLGGVAPLHLMCDPQDLATVVEPRAPASGLPTITIYEKVPAGVGYAQQLFASMPDLLRAAYDLVIQCPCEHGCPACVGPILEHDYALDTKALASALLKNACPPDTQFLTPIPV